MSDLLTLDPLDSTYTPYTPIDQPVPPNDAAVGHGLRAPINTAKTVVTGQAMQWTQAGVIAHYSTRKYS
jgi:hypothetical protein